VILNKFAGLTDGMERKRKVLYDLTDFTYINRTGDRTLKNCMIAVLLQFISVANGDMTKIKIDIVERSPYIKLSLSGLSLDKAIHYIEAFEDYVTETVDALTEKLP
jgi:hypothetical protein